MEAPKQDVLLASDFNAGNFSGYLRNARGKLSLEPRTAPFGQVSQLLIDEGNEAWRNRPDATVVWTRPQAVVPAFGDLLAYERVERDGLLDEVDRVSKRLLSC